MRFAEIIERVPARAAAVPEHHRGDKTMPTQATLSGARPAPVRRQAALWRSELWWVLAATLATYLSASALELSERIARWLGRYERWQADELPLTATVLACGLAVYAFRRRREALTELQLRMRAETQASALLAHNRELARQLIALQENERRTLARELHDELGQSCSALRVETAFLRGCAPDDRAGLLAAAARADAAAHALFSGVRGLLRRLRPANLDSLGLVAALQELCGAWSQRSGVRCIFTHEGALQALDDAVNITVYRVAQEALNNVLRHAGAGSVRIVLAASPADGLLLSVQDDGQGTDLQAATRGLGLLGASERAAALGGSLQLRSQPGQGLMLRLQLPASVLQEAA
jgi:signal transduction histidine kinase